MAKSPNVSGEIISNSKGASLKDEASGQMLIAQRITHSGPLAPVEQFAGYEKVIPGAAKIILEFAKEEQKIGKYDVILSHAADLAKIFWSSFVSLSLIGLAGYCVYMDEPLLGGVTAIGSVVASIMMRDLRSKN